MEERMERRIFYHPFSNQSKGQIIAINKTFPGKHFAFEIFSDRCVGLRFSLEDQLYTVLNCYGPAMAVEREGFLEDQKEIINARILNILLVCGDFNMIYDNEMDIIAGAQYSKREAESFSNFLKLSELEDTWRIMNGNHREFTWSRNTPYTARRLDHILFCDTNMSQHLITSNIKDFACTNHRAVMTNIHEDTFPRGPSRWHFNSSH